MINTGDKVVYFCLKCGRESKRKDLKVKIIKDGTKDELTCKCGLNVFALLKLR